jgi:Fe-S oxidoreductase
MASYINNKLKGSNSDLQNLGKNIKEVISMASYCYACNRCVNVCPLSHLDIFFPRMLVRDLVFSSLEEVLNNHNIWNCLTCGQCTIYCPMTQEKLGVRIPELILELRQISKNNKIQINRIAQSETHNQIFPLLSKMMANNPLYPNKLEFLGQKDLKVTNSGEIAYFIGCLPLMGEIFYNFNFNYTDIPITIISLLNEANIIPVVLNEKCCGHDILWGEGNKEIFKKLVEYNTQLYKDAGVKTVIVGCAECYRTWKYDYPKLIDDFDFNVFHFSEFFLKEKILENIKFPLKSRIKVTFHDSCRMGRLGGKLYDTPRELIRQLLGVELIEMDNIKDNANCCGVSTFLNCNEYTRFLRENRIKEAIDTKAEYLIVTCPKCLTHFNCYLCEPAPNEEIKESRHSITVVDLASFIGKLLLIA